MLIHVEDLKEGDEFIIGSNSHLRYFKVLRTPTIHPTKKTGGWAGGPPLAPKYKAVRCSTNVVETVKNWTGYSGKIHKKITRVFNCTPEGHNKIMSVDLTYKDLWLVNRK